MPIRRARLIALAVFAATCSTTSIAAADPALPGSTQLVSRSSGFGLLGASSDGNSDNEANAVSANGRFVVFTSTAPDIVGEASSHAVVRDNQTGAVTIADRVGSGGALGDQYLQQVAISADGSTVCFTSSADNLVPGVADGNTHIYVRTLATGALVVADRSNAAALGNQSAQDCVLDADGNRVAFTSYASNLVPADNNGYGDVFERNLTAGTTAAADTFNGVQGDKGADDPQLSTDGSIVAFHSYSTTLLGAGVDANGRGDIFTRVLGPSNPVLISRADGVAGAQSSGEAHSPSMSDNGQHVAFETNATNLGDGDSDGTDDIHVRDVVAGTTTLVSRATGAVGAKGDATSTRPAISGDGSAVAFSSYASNLGAVSSGPFGDDQRPSLVFVRALGPRTTVLASRAPGAAGPPSALGASDPSITANGTGVVWGSSAGNLDPLATGRFGEVFQRDMTAATTRLVSRPADASGRPGTVGVAHHGGSAVSADGRYVAFVSTSDLGLGTVAGGLGYVRDTLTGATALVSRASGADGALAPVDGSRIEISADGSHVAFDSLSPAVGGDNQNIQVYVRDLRTNITTLASVSSSGQPAAHDARGGAIDQDGDRVAFRSGDDLAPGDGNGAHDAYVRDLAAGTTTLASVAANGAAGNAGIGDALDLSADGTRLAFVDSADNLVGGDTNNSADVFVRDLAAGTTTIVDRLPSGQTPKNGALEASISADGTRVSFEAFDVLVPGVKQGTGEVYVRDLPTGGLTLASAAGDGQPADAQSFISQLSDDGDHVVFYSPAKNLPGGANGGGVYERDLAAATTTVVGAANGSAEPLRGAGTPVPSADGGCVAFAADSPDTAPNAFGGVQFSQIYLRTVHHECPLIAPDTTITAGPAATIHTATATFAFAATYANVHFECALDGGPLQACVSGLQTPALPDGVHRFTVRAIDAGGEADQTPALSTFTVAVAPVLSRVSVTHAKFRVGKARTAVIATAKAKKPTGGTTFRWTLSEAATVKVAIAQRVAGKRSGKRCVIPSRKLRKHAPCTRVLARVGLARHAKAGAGSLSFSGRWGKHRLAPGSYQATLTAADAAGNRSGAVTIRFRVVA